MSSVRYRPLIRQSALPGRRRVLAALALPLLAGVALIVVLARADLSTGGGDMQMHVHATVAPAPGLPGFAFVSDNARMGYIRAQLYPDLFQHLGCYCGCALPAATLPHKSLEECFLKPGGGWETHGSGCGVCGDIAAEAQADLDAGMSPLQIRQAVDARFGDMAPNSLSPPPPAG